MDLEYIILGINLYGYDIRMLYVGHVDNQTYYPLGKKIRYTILGTEYITYSDIPILKYDNIQITIVNKYNFNNILTTIINQMEKHNIPLYKNLGVNIAFINHFPLIGNDNKKVILVNDGTPRQSQIRVLYDIIDQLADARSNVKIIYYLKNKNNAFADYYDTNLSFSFDKPNIGNCEDSLTRTNGNDIVFMNDNIGRIVYDIYTGRFDVTLTENFKNILINEFHKNYSGEDNIQIYILALEIYANNFSVVFN